MGQSHDDYMTTVFGIDFSKYPDQPDPDDQPDLSGQQLAFAGGEKFQEPVLSPSSPATPTAPKPPLPKPTPPKPAPVNPAPAPAKPKPTPKPDDPPDPPPPGPGSPPTGGRTTKIKGNLHVAMNSISYSDATATVSFNLPGSESILGAVMITGGNYTWGGIPINPDGPTPPDAPISDPGPVQLSVVLLSSSGQNAARPAGATLQGGRAHAPLPTISFNNVSGNAGYSIRFQIPSDPPAQPRGIPLHIWFDLTAWTPGP
jgi:hypothetical protein